MDVKSVTEHALFTGLPHRIGLPSCLPGRPEYRRTRLNEVCVADELPPYLLLGRLDRDGFRSTEAGWSARWAGSIEDTFVSAEYDRATRRLQLRQVWRGVEGGTAYTQCDDFGRAVQALYMPFPESWDAALAARLEGAYRIKYAAAGTNTYGFTGIPDGGFKTLGVPVPVARLGDFYDCLERLSEAPELTAPVGGRIELRLSAVNYVTGRGPDRTERPEALVEYEFETNGLLPVGVPELETATNGTSAWTVRRLVYLALLQVPFAGVEFVVEWLAAHGLVQRCGEDTQAHAAGVEFDAFVGPPALDLQSRSLAWMDASRGRRVYYLLNSEAELASGGVDRMQEAAAQSGEEAQELIRQAKLVSVRQRNQVLRDRTDRCLATAAAAEVVS